MRTLKHLLQKEFLQIFRNRIILRLIIAAPIIQLLVIPMTADYEFKNINLTIVDHDHSSYSRQMIRSITGSGYFRLIDYSTSYSEAFEHIESDETDLIIEIPEDFEKEMMRHESPAVFIAVNAINGMKAQVGNGYMLQILQKFNREIQIRSMSGHHGAQPFAIDVKPSFWFNPSFNYPLFMVPGILVILVTMVGSYLTALNIVKEKEVGTIDQINVSPISKSVFILGKLIPFWFLGMFVFTVGLYGIGYLVYGIIPAGNAGLLYAFLAVYLVAILGIGLLVSTYAGTQQQAMSLMFLLMMIFVLMSGLFTPIESMPIWAKWIAYANPVTWFIEVMRLVVIKGSHIGDLLLHFGVTLVLALIFNTWAIWNYSKSS